MTFESATTIIGDVCPEVGLTKVADPYASTDPAIVQLCALLTNCGRELLGALEWQLFVKQYTHTIALPADASGILDLPTDFGWMIDQTGWSPTSRLPLGGPLDQQDWTYIVNTNLASSTIYVTFQVSAGKFNILPAPPPAGAIINFRYISDGWVESAAASGIYSNRVTASANIVRYPPILMVKFLKLRFLEAKGFDTTSAVTQFKNVWEMWAPKDKPAPILNVAKNRYYPYLGWRNIPETLYGSP